MDILRNGEYKLEPPEPVYIPCPECGGEVYEGDYLIDYEGKGVYICARCVLDKLRELERDPEALALAVKSRTQRVGGRYVPPSLRPLISIT